MVDGERKEYWYMIDGSLITNLPDTWGTNQEFILLPIFLAIAVYYYVLLNYITFILDRFLTYHMFIFNRHLSLKLYNTH